MTRSNCISKKTQALISALAVAAHLVGCVDTPGTIEDAETDTRFVNSTERLYYTNLGGDQREVDLDGNANRGVFNDSLVWDVSDDGAVWVLGDVNTNLFIFRASSGDLEAVSELSHRVASAVLSPDAATVAVSRHADFSQPASEQKDDNAIYWVNTSSLNVDVTASTDDTYVTLQWSSDGEGVVATSAQGQSEWITYPSKLRTVVPSSVDLRLLPHRSLRKERDVCVRDEEWRLVGKGSGSDQGLQLQDANGSKSDLVNITGRERSAGDAEPTITDAFFTHDCAYVVFVFNKSIWVVDTATRKVGPLTAGSDPFSLPLGS